MAKRKAAEQADLPTCMQRIDVLWELDNGSVVWWGAEVLTINSMAAGRTIATGSILYDARHEYDAQICEVDFIVGQLIRPKCVKKNKVLSETSWRTSSDTEDMTQDEIEWQPTEGKRRRTSRSRQTYSKQAQHDKYDKWQSSTHAMGSGHDNSQRTDTDTGQHGQTHLEGQTSVAACMLKVTNMERTLQHMSKNDNQRASDNRILELKHFIRRAILHQLQRPLRRATTGNGLTDGGETTGYVCATTACSLSDFSMLVGSIACTGHTVNYVPSLTTMQQPSRATTSLSVIFESFRQFCVWLEIRDYYDRETMFFKEGGSSSTTRREVMTRVLGTTYATSTGSYYLFGRSIASELRLDVDVLHRRSAQWDGENDKYADPLREIKSNIPAMPERLHNDEVDQLRLNAFQVAWRRDVPLSQKMWTEDVRAHSHIVTGNIQVTLPAIFFFGHKTCAEVAKALSPKLCEELL